jgi:hypothetical protein
VKPSGVIRITNMFGGTAAVIPVNADGGNVLPDSARAFSPSNPIFEDPADAGDYCADFSSISSGFTSSR